MGRSGAGGVIIQILGDASQAIQAIDQVTKKVEELENAGDSGAGGIEDLTDSFDDLLAQIPAALGILGAGAAAIKQFFDLSEEGAQMERLSDTSTQLAETYGANMDQIVRKVRAASFGTITDLKIMESANKAMMLGVSANAKELADLTQIAIYRGRALGLSAEQAFEQISIGIGRLSPKILDNLGIVVDAESNYERYAETIGKTADELTEYEKREALKNAVLQEGNKLLAATGGLAADNASQFEKLDAQVENITNNFKEGLAPAGGAVITALNGILFGYKELRDALADHQDDMADTIGSYEDYRAEAIRSASAAGMFTKHAAQQAGAFKDGKIEVDKFLVSLGFLSEAEFNYMMITKQAVTINGDYVDMAEQVRRGNADIAESAEDAAAAATKVKEQLGELKTFMKGELGQEYDDFNQKQTALKDQARELLDNIQELEGKDWLTSKQREQLEENRSKLKEIQDQIARNAEEHELASKKILFNLLEQNLALGGLTANEKDILTEVANKWGLVDDKTYEAYQKIDEYVGLLESGVIPDMKTFSDMVAGLSDKSITIYTRYINEFIESRRRGDSGGYTGMQDQERAGGGGVFPGMGYTYQERGAEGFKPNQAGVVVPAHVVNNYNLQMGAVAQRMLMQALALERL